MNPCTEDRSVKGVNLIDCILCGEGGEFVKLPGIEILVISGSKNAFCKQSDKKAGFAVALDDFAQFFTRLFRVGEQDSVRDTPT